MKTITTINWVIVGSYGLVLLWVFASSSNSQQDAAGRGMLAGLLFLTCLFLVALVVLNRLPYQWSKITALVLGGGPLILWLLSVVVGPLLADGGQSGSSDEMLARGNGSFYFHDPVRQQLAAYIATGNVAQLQAGLQQPIPDLNDSGEEHTTLLDFATARALENPSPETLKCIELLLAKGATLKTTDTLHQPTHFLAIGHKPLLAWFMAKGADPNAKSSTGVPILFHALFAGNDDGDRAANVTLLLDYGADPNEIPPNGELAIDTSALMYAADQELWAVCQLLLDKGARPSYKTLNGRDVYAIMTDKEKLIYDDFGKTPPADFIALKERLNGLSTP